MQKTVISSRHKRGKAAFLPGLYLPFSQVYAWESDFPVTQRYTRSLWGEVHIHSLALHPTTPAWVKTEQKVTVREEGRHSRACGIWLGLDSGYHRPWVWSWVLYLSSQSRISPNSPLRELLLVLNWGGTWKEGEACASFLWLTSETPSAAPAGPVRDTTSSGPGTCGEQPKPCRQVVKWTGERHHFPAS